MKQEPPGYSMCRDASRTSDGAPGAAHAFGITAPEFACFMFFWAINMAVIYKGIDSIRLLLNVKAPLLIDQRKLLDLVVPVGGKLGLLCFAG